MGTLTLKTRLLLGGLLAVIIPIILVGIISVNQSADKLFKIAAQTVITTSESMARTIDMYMEEQLVVAKTISYSNGIIAASERVFKAGSNQGTSEIANAQKELNKIKSDAKDRLSSIVLVNKNDGLVFASSDDGKYNGLDLSSRDYLKTAFDGTPFVGAVVRSKATGNLVCTVAYPIYSSDGAEVTGAVVTVLWLDHLTDIIGEINVGETGYVYLTDSEGTYIVHPEKSRVLTMSLSDIDKNLKLAVTASVSASADTMEYLSKGRKRFCAFSTVPITGWKVLAIFPMEELLAPGRSLAFLILTVGLAALILASLFFYFFAGSISRAVSKTAQVARSLSVGDTEIEIGKTRNDEIGEMLGAVKETADAMKAMAEAADKGASGDLTVEVMPRSERDVLGKAFSSMMERTRKQISDIQEAANVISSSTSEIMASVSQVSSGTAETSTSMSETTTTVEELKQTAQLSSKKASRVSDLGRQTAETSQDGITAIDESIDGMNRVREQMNGIADTVVHLSEQSRSIGEITATVTDITEQINLLAVNASIEAAKAGEQGRGFSVVAQEMKSLADQAKHATVQIRNILSDIQRAISSSVMSTEQGNKAVEEGLTLINKSGDAIRTLAGNVEEAANASIQIMASSQQQQVGVEQVAIAMENIQKASAQTAASMKQTENAVHDLHELGMRLKAMVEQYKV